MAIESIAKTLGTGSGIDITALVNGLVDAQFAAKQDAIAKREEALSAQISAASTIKSNISGFDAALKSLIRGGTLSTQATSSNTSILKASALPGANVTGLSASVEVRQLAASQSAAAAAVSDKTAAIGTGTLTLTFGTATVENGAMTAFTAGSASSVDIAITSDNSSLTGIRDAINAAKAGVTATILSDSSGSRLVLKGTSGASQAFTLTATEDVGAEGLAALDIGVGATGTTIGTSAKDALVAVDGIQFSRTSNTISDLITGTKLELVAASVGTNVTLGTQTPTDALGQAVNDFVDTYNELLAQLKQATDPVTGPLRSDSATRSLMNSLRGLSVKTIVTDTTGTLPTSLAAIGVATNRDGTLTVDQSRLATSLADYPTAVASMFRTTGGLSSALSSISISATSASTGLGATLARYSSDQARLATDRQKALDAAESMRTRMTRQFAGMDAAVAAYKSTQSFLDNQVAAWNARNG